MFINQSNIGFPDSHHSFKKELALAIIPAVVSLAVQSAFEHFAAYVQHKRDEKSKAKELQSQNEQPTEEEMQAMEEEQEKALRTIVREEVVEALKEVLVVTPPAKPELTKQPRKIKRTNAS